MDCTDTGASPPTGTDPTMICLELRRGAIGREGIAGIPKVVVTGRVPHAEDCLDATPWRQSACSNP
jgi:hypothetical protein